MRQMKHWALMASVGLIPIPRMSTETTCKAVQTKMDCNTCDYEVCTDGFRQWESEVMRCTDKNCVHIGKFNPNDWQGIKVRVVHEDRDGEIDSEELGNQKSNVESETIVPEVNRRQKLEKNLAGRNGSSTYGAVE